MTTVKEAREIINSHLDQLENIWRLEIAESIIDLENELNDVLDSIEEFEDDDFLSTTFMNWDKKISSVKKMLRINNFVL